MKRIVKIVSLLLLVVMVLTMFASCQQIQYRTLFLVKEENRPAKILNIINARMNKADSYTIAGTGYVSSHISGIDVMTKMTVNEVMVDKSGDNLMKQASILYEYEYSDSSLNQSIQLKEGYQNGQMYYNVSHDDYESKLKSSITKEAFLEHDADMTVATLTSGFDGVNATAKKDENGSWVVTISGIDPLAIKNLNLNISSITPGYYIDSLDMVITVNSDLTEWESELNYNFKPFEDYDFTANGFYVPVATFTNKISAIDSTTAESINLDDYTESADLTVINKLDRDINEIFDMEEGRLSIGIVHKIKYLGKQYEVSEYDNVDYGNKDGKFYYNISGTSMGEKIDVSYADGKRIQNNDTSKSNDSVEKAFLYSLVTGNAYNVLAIKNVRVDENVPDTYIIDMFLSEEMLQSMTIDKYEHNQYTVSFTVTYKNGKISNIQASIKSWAQGVVGGSTYDISVKTLILDPAVSV